MNLGKRVMPRRIFKLVGKAHEKAESDNRALVALMNRAKFMLKNKMKRPDLEPAFGLFMPYAYGMVGFHGDADADLKVGGLLYSPAQKCWIPKPKDVEGALLAKMMDKLKEPMRVAKFLKVDVLANTDAPPNQFISTSHGFYLVMYGYGAVFAQDLLPMEGNLEEVDGIQLDDGTVLVKQVPDLPTAPERTEPTAAELNLVANHHEKSEKNDE